MKFRHQSMHACNMHVPYLKNVLNPCMLHVCFKIHACHMHDYSILSLEISYMKLSCMLRSVKDWDQLNFIIFTMSCKHSYSKMKSNEVM